MKTFYLVDGHSQIFRAYYAPFGQLTSPTGEPTKAVYVFTQMLLSILRDKRPDYIAVALDVSDATTRRRQVYPEYKANRDVTPEDLHPQVERIEEILRLLEVPTLRREGYEADDIIASVAERLAEKGEDVEVRVVSRDKDLYQLISDRVKLWDPQKDELIDAEALERSKGFRPEQAVEIQTLTGDSTDNIPGVPGVGPKKARDLIRRFGTAEAVVEHADELTPKLRENMLASKDQLPMARRLVTLERDVELPFDLEACRTPQVRPERLVPVFQELGFRRLIESLEAQGTDGGSPEAGAGGTGAATAGNTASGTPARAGAPGSRRSVHTTEELDAFVAELREVRRFALDTETTSLRPVDCDLVGISISWADDASWWIPVRSSRERTLDPETVLEALRSVLEDPGVEKYGQNIKYDLVVLRSAGVEVQGVAFDSMVASYLLHPERRNHSMDALARDVLGCDTTPITAVIGSGRRQIPMLEADPEALREYAGEDAEITWRLHEALAADLSGYPDLERLFHEVEMPLVEVLADMELTGVAVDLDRLESIRSELDARIEGLAKQIHRAAGREFTIDSPKQLGEVLFDEQGLRVVKRTKTSRSTDASVLQTLAVETAHPLPGLVLEYRELTKLRGTYVDPLPGLVSPRTGRIHASFNQTVAATGRLSSSEPNLQNIPIRTEQGRQIRRAFVAGDPGHVLLSADYSQIELRILAHLSGDPALREAFLEDKDIHAAVAAEVYGVSLDSVTPEQRRRAKGVNFGIIYGQGAFGLAQSLGIPRAEATEFIRRYKARYAGIVEFVDQCVATAQEKGWVSTLLGRRRPIPEIRSKNQTVRAQGERLAINTVVQGSAADLIKKAMLRLHRRRLRDELALRLLIQVHDELVFEASRFQAAELAAVVREEMAGALPLDVPVRVDVGWGDDWLGGKG